ncbi:hypothetical protein C4D60_Mb11t23190 [Musa balbisiana]|uniref:Auxin-responsive protein n=1 Tax=Musa balbisiana TaxID=52838 RepID=A0A4S8J6E3_MUSBA|nr:hypothetical protein C4D60_Mb11t23190 [Musa balbisiana]
MRISSGSLGNQQNERAEEQVAASTNKEFDSLPSYPSLPPQLVCQLHNVTMHADVETDEVYGQMTLQPLSPDFSQQPPAQELIAKDLHSNEWKFRHIFRGQPKRHLLTTGWSVNDNNQLLLGIRRANRPQTVMPSSVLSSDSMHIGLLAAAAHAAATNSRFTIFYNPRASPSEFVIPLAKYVKAVHHTRVSVGMRFRMLFETEESSVRRYMGTITGISDLDSVRWPNSHWRSVKVGWDESTAGQRQPRCCIAIHLNSLSNLGGKDDISLNSPLLWLRNGGNTGLQSLNFQGVGVTPWTQPNFDTPILGLQPGMYQAMAAAGVQETRTTETTKLISPSVLPFQQTQNITTRTSPMLPSQSQNFSNSNGNFVRTSNASSLHDILHQLSPEDASNLHNWSRGNQVFTSSPWPSKRVAIESMLPSGDQCVMPQVEQSGVSQPNIAQRSVTLPPFPGRECMVDQDDNVDGQNHLLFGVNIDASPVLVQNGIANLSNIRNETDSMNMRYAASNFVASSGNDFGLNQTLTGSNSLEEPGFLHSPENVDSLNPKSRTSVKRVAIESMLPSGDQCVMPQVEQSGVSQPNIAQRSVTLPPFPGRECMVDQDDNVDGQNHLLFGVNIDASPVLVQNGIANLSNIRNETDSMNMRYAASNFVASSGNDFGLNQTLTGSNSLEEPGFLHSPENVDSLNPKSRTSVKVYKSGSFGRSLDITKFSSYHELRSELGHLFGLEGQLEDPLRSGWQLVFVDRENDILLVGDDPWQEFVNSVWCIKILSPQEVQQMGKQSVEFLNSTCIKRLPNNSCDDYINRQDSRTLSTGIASVGTLEY